MLGKDARPRAKAGQFAAAHIEFFQGAVLAGERLANLGYSLVSKLVEAQIKRP